mmetsp:Transcript_63955/g.114165  ORF Transcript_63955/g.114165 Transcript_63955/m.114165 type:complete len:85 (+) Transcript_63955:226-480(+)
MTGGKKARVNVVSTSALNTKFLTWNKLHAKIYPSALNIPSQVYSSNCQGVHGSKISVNNQMHSLQSRRLRKLFESGAVWHRMTW